jgi:V-type H+-transporting ATPase subunit H
MAQELPIYVVSTQSNLRARPVPWDGAVRAGHVTEADLALIKAVDKVRKEPRREAINANLDGYVKLIIGDGKKGVLQSGRSDIIQYMLVLISDILRGTLL